MAVFQTAGDPPSVGSTSRVAIGCSRKTRPAETNTAATNGATVLPGRSFAGAAAGVMIGLRRNGAGLPGPDGDEGLL